MAIDPSTIAAFEAGAIRLHTFVEAGFDTGTAYLWDGVGSIMLDRGTYKGTGSFLSVDVGDQTLSEVARQFTVTLSGAYVDENGNAQAVDGFADQIGQDLNTTRIQNRPASVFVGVTDLEGTRLLVDPVFQVSGVMDVPKASEGSDGFSSVTVTVEDRTLRASKATPRRIGPADHQRINDGSTYLAQTTELKRVRVPWGAASV